MKMKSQFSSVISPLIPFSLSVGVVFGVFSCFGQATLAQSTNPSTLGNSPTNEASATEGDSPINSPVRGSLNPLDLIHQSNLGRSRGMGEFKQDSLQNINNAATDFKRQQQELLQQQPSPSSPATPEN